MRHRISMKLTRLLMVIGTLTLLVVGAANAQDGPILRIGVLDDVFGPISNGARIAVETINAAGGVSAEDGTQSRLELVVQPTTAGQTIEAAVLALDSQDVIAVLGPETGAQVVDNLTLLQSLNVPVFVPATGDTLLAADTTGRVFRIRAADVWQGRALADYLATVLGFSSIATVQLDMDSTASVIGFSTAAQALNVNPAPALQLESESALPGLVEQLVTASPQAVVAYGSAGLAAELHTLLRANGYTGVYAASEANDPLFKANVADELQDILTTVTWAYTYRDAASSDFTLAYARTYGELPGEVSAAAFDAVYLIAAAAAQPGELSTNVEAQANVVGVQGLMQPANLAATDTLTDVAVVELNPFGVPRVLARYRDNEQLPDDDLILVPVAPAAPTPEGVYIIITSERQNIRMGPSVDFEILGVLNEGETAQVIGATADNTWVVISYRGQQGWLATYLLTVVGDLDTVPIITPPPTPTPAVTPTPLPPQEPDLLIDSVTISPQPIVPNTPFTVAVTVRNAGMSAAGAFAVGATLPPSNQATSAVVGGLPAGQSIVVNLQGAFGTSGFYTAGIIVDVNNQVAEGVIGEQNNTYNVNYGIDRPILSTGTQTLNLGDTIDLEDNAVQGDANWNGDGGVALDAIFGARVGIIPGTDIALAHYDLINTNTVNRESIPRAELNPGVLVGIITADGNRGVMRVDAVSEQQLTVTYRVYAG